MRVQPDLEGFRELARRRRVITVAARLVADADTPITIYHQLCADRAGTFLFESVEQGVSSRYSFIGVNSVATLTSVEGEATWLGNAPVGLPSGGDPLQAMAQSLALLQNQASLQPEGQPEGQSVEQGDEQSEEQADAGAGYDLPPLTSGLVGYLGFDIVRRVEHLPDRNPDDLGVPELGMLLVSDMVAMDHQTGELWLMANAINFDDTDERVDWAYQDAVQRVEHLAARLNQPRPPMLLDNAQAHAATDDQGDPYSNGEVIRQRSDQEFESSVRAAVEQIHAGEAFQVVVSQRFDVPTQASALDIYRRLRLGNPSPYMYLLRMEGFDIVGSSPEALVTVRGGTARTHPIAGTRPRGADVAADVALERELIADEKERAEHLMLVDLGRNDLGRVCEPGTVEVVEFMKVRRYSHVMHLESAISGRLTAGRTALDATMACFPAGTLSGAPKVRAMEIIDSLEVAARGTYGGVVGWFDFDGDSDVAIAIRTAMVKDGIAHIQAGGGIVADSDPAAENEESKNKARAVVNAIRAANQLRGVQPSGVQPSGVQPSGERS